MKIKVVVFKESAGNGQKVWVAQALEQDICAQANVGATAIGALQELGFLFEARDNLRRQFKLSDPPEAPRKYWDMWQQGDGPQWNAISNPVQISSMYTADVRIYVND